MPTLIFDLMKNNKINPDLFHLLVSKNIEKERGKVARDDEFMCEFMQHLEFLKSSYFLNYPFVDDESDIDIEIDNATCVDSFYNFSDTSFIDLNTDMYSLADYLNELRMLKSYRNWTLALIMYNDWAIDGTLKISTDEMEAYDLNLNKRNLLKIKHTIEAMIFSLMNDPFSYFEEKFDLSLTA